MQLWKQLLKVNSIFHTVIICLKGYILLHFLPEMSVNEIIQGYGKILGPEACKKTNRFSHSKFVSICFDELSLFRVHVYSSPPAS